MVFSQAAEAVIKESVEPLLEEYRPAGISSLKFSKFSLGTVAPKIEGCDTVNETNIFIDIFIVHFLFRLLVLCSVLMLNQAA